MSVLCLFCVCVTIIPPEKNNSSIKAQSYSGRGAGATKHDSPIRDDLLQVIGQQLPSHVDPKRKNRHQVAAVGVIAAASAGSRHLTCGCPPSFSCCGSRGRCG